MGWGELSGKNPAKLDVTANFSMDDRSSPSAAIPIVLCYQRFLNPDRHFLEYKSTKYSSELFSKMATISPHSFKNPHRVIHRFYQLVRKLLKVWENRFNEE
jgi:hypothetical protein